MDTTNNEDFFKSLTKHDNHFNKLLADPNTICVDMRNHYESEIGYFENAITPDVDTFRDSLDIIEAQLKEHKEDKNLFFFVALFFLHVNVQASANELWDFPVKPGTSEWKKFKSHDQKVASLQIPASVLKKMSTRELLTICLRYPFWNDMYAFNSVQQGYESVFNKFNRLQLSSKG